MLIMPLLHFALTILATLSLTYAMPLHASHLYIWSRRTKDTSSSDGQTDHGTDRTGSSDNVDGPGKFVSAFIPEDGENVVDNRFPLGPVIVALAIFVVIFCVTIRYIYTSVKVRRDAIHSQLTSRHSQRARNLPHYSSSAPSPTYPTPVHIQNNNVNTSTTYLPPYSAERLPQYSDGRSHGIGIGQGLRVTLSVVTAPAVGVDAAMGEADVEIEERSPTRSS